MCDMQKCRKARKHLRRSGERQSKSYQSQKVISPLIHSRSLNPKREKPISVN